MIDVKRRDGLQLQLLNGLLGRADLLGRGPRTGQAPENREPDEHDALFHSTTLSPRLPAHRVRYPPRVGSRRQSPFLEIRENPLHAAEGVPVDALDDVAHGLRQSHVCPTIRPQCHNPTVRSGA